MNLKSLYVMGTEGSIDEILDLIRPFIGNGIGQIEINPDYNPFSQEQEKNLGTAKRDSAVISPDTSSTKNAPEEIK